MHWYESFDLTKPKHHETCQYWWRQDRSLLFSLHLSSFVSIQLWGNHGDPLQHIWMNNSRLIYSHLENEMCRRSVGYSYPIVHQHWIHVPKIPAPEAILTIWPLFAASIGPRNAFRTYGEFEMVRRSIFSCLTQKWARTLTSNVRWMDASSISSRGLPLTTPALLITMVISPTSAFTYPYGKGKTERWDLFPIVYLLSSSINIISIAKINSHRMNISIGYFIENLVFCVLIALLIDIPKNNSGAKSSQTFSYTSTQSRT